jgi:NYN domain
MPKKVCFLVDGFNMYYSLRQVEDLSKQRVKWLDLHRLLGGYLQAVRQAVGERVELSGIHYFSALATHMTTRDPGVVNRHCTYVSALESTGVRVTLSRFKEKSASCPKCHHAWKRHEEKETDVAIGVRLIEVLVRGEGDTVVLVTGDTDLIPAIRTAKGLFPKAKIGVAFPFMRHNTDLEKAADYSFKIDQKALQKAQFPDELTLANGTVIHRPSGW